MAPPASKAAAGDDGSRLLAGATAGLAGPDGTAVVTAVPKPAELNQHDRTLLPPPLGRLTFFQLALLYGAIVADIVVMAYTDPLSSAPFVTQLLLFSLQFFLLVAIVLVFFLLTSNTLYIKLGLYNRYLRDYKHFFLIAGIALGLFTAAGGYKLAQSYNDTPLVALWQQPGYQALWIIMRTAVLLYWCSAAYSSVHCLSSCE